MDFCLIITKQEANNEVYNNYSCCVKTGFPSKLENIRLPILTNAALSKLMNKSVKKYEQVDINIIYYKVK